MTCHVNEMLRGAILILHQSIADAGLVGQVPRGKGKQGGLSVLPFDGFYKSLWPDRQNSVACARSDHFVGIVGENRKNFRAIRRREMCATSAYSKFPLACGAPMPKILNNFRA